MNRLVYNSIFIIIIFVFIFGGEFKSEVFATSDNCKGTAVIFLRGSGQNSLNIFRGDNDVYIDSNINDKENQTIMFFNKLSSRVTGTKEYISVHNFEGKYNNYGYVATNATDIYSKPTHRTDVDNKYLESVMDGKEELLGFLKERMAECPYQKIILGGYSQGAHVLGEALWGLSPIERGRVSYAAFFGDPKYNAHMGGLTKSVGPWVRGNANRFSTGILGARKFYIPADVLHKGSWCDSSDPICTATNILGTGGFILAFDKIDATHSKDYQKDANWIEQASNEIAGTVNDDSNTIGATIGSMWIKEKSASAQLDIALVVDNSGTMAHELNILQLGAKNFIANLKAQSWDTKIAVVNYSDNDYPKDYWLEYWLAKVNTDFTSDDTVLYNALHSFSVYGMANNNSAMYSGIMKSFKDLHWRTGAQKKVIVLTNNSAREADPGGYTSGDVIKTALELDPVAISSINLKNIQTNNYPAQNSLANLALKTNGTSITGTLSNANYIYEQINIINKAPVALIDGPSSGNTTNGIDLSAGYSYDPDSYITSYKWDCDNNGTWDYTDTQPLVNCNYASSYNGLVVLEVTSKDGQSAKAIQSVNISSQLAQQILAPVIPEATINNRLEDSVNIQINNIYNANTLIALSDVNGEVFEYFKPTDTYKLENITSGQLDIYLSAVDSGLTSELIKVSIPEYTKPEPVITESSKEIPISESNPEWLLDLEKTFYSSLATSTQNTPIITPTQNTFSYFVPVTSGVVNNPVEQNITNVQGLSSEVKNSFNSQVKITGKTNKPSMVILYIGAGLLIAGFIALLYRLKKS